MLFHFFEFITNQVMTECQYSVLFVKYSYHETGFYFIPFYFPGILQGE